MMYFAVQIKFTYMLFCFHYTETVMKDVLLGNICEVIKEKNG